jgi:ferredoxin
MGAKSQRHGKNKIKKRGYSMKVIVDKNLCVGCELCAQICPAVFSMGPDSFAEAISGPVPAEQEASCREAAESCPVDAIEITG